MRGEPTEVGWYEVTCRDPGESPFVAWWNGNYWLSGPNSSAVTNPASFRGPLIHRSDIEEKLESVAFAMHSIAFTRTLQYRVEILRRHLLGDEANATNVFTLDGGSTANRLPIDSDESKGKGDAGICMVPGGANNVFSGGLSISSGSTEKKPRLTKAERYEMRDNLCKLTRPFTLTERAHLACLDELDARDVEETRMKEEIADMPPKEFMDSVTQPTCRDIDGNEIKVGDTVDWTHGDGWMMKGERMTVLTVRDEWITVAKHGGESNGAEFRADFFRCAKPEPAACDDPPKCPRCEGTRRARYGAVWQECPLCSGKVLSAPQDVPAESPATEAAKKRDAYEKLTATIEANSLDENGDIKVKTVEVSDGFGAATEAEQKSLGQVAWDTWQANKHKTLIQELDLVAAAVEAAVLERLDNELEENDMLRSERDQLREERDYLHGWKLRLENDVSTGRRIYKELSEEADQIREENAKLASQSNDFMLERDSYMKSYADACERRNELLTENAKLTQYKMLFESALSHVDKVFQKCSEIPDPILPDFAKLGEDKFAAVERLATEYAKLTAEKITGHVAWHPDILDTIKGLKEENAKLTAEVERWVHLYSELSNECNDAKTMRDANANELARLKSPPVVKEKPDCCGLWCDEDCGPRIITQHEGFFGFSVGVFFIQCTKGRWIKIENPQFPPPVDEVEQARDRLASVIAAQLANTAAMTGDEIEAVIREQLAGWGPKK